jgi:hypothetical protein
VGELVDLLDDGQGDPAVRDTFADGVPAGSVAVFALSTPFSGVAPGSGTLTDAAVPQV